MSSQKEYGEDGEWTELGKLEKTELTNKIFDDLFLSEGWKEGLSANRIRKDNVNAWQLVYNQEVLYYVLQQNNGELYLAYGYYDYLEKDDFYSDDTSIRWLYKLAVGTTSQVGGADGLQTTYSSVQVLETTSDTQESSYRVGATLPTTDFASMGKVLKDKTEKEWNTYDSMTEEQRLTSSKLWGTVGIPTDTWNECEEAIGFEVYNPLESLEWLNKTGYFGMESTDPSTPATHVRAIANATQTTDRTISEINVTAGYNNDSVRITLTATISANTGMFTIGSVCNGYATYEQNTVNTESGIPVLIVTTNETNNTGYYNGDYYDPTAYWVKDNVFYTLRVFGDAADKAKIQDALNRILAEI